MITQFDLRSVYAAPFKYDGIGYIWDANRHMVADFSWEEGGPFRVRGWGRIRTTYNKPEELYDALEVFDGVDRRRKRPAQMRRDPQHRVEL